MTPAEIYAIVIIGCGAMAALVWFVWFPKELRDILTGKAGAVDHNSIHPTHEMGARFRDLCPGPDERWTRRCKLCRATQCEDGGGKSTDVRLPLPCVNAAWPRLNEGGGWVWPDGKITRDRDGLGPDLREQ
jgi:hypothetical protein